jgi:poly(3-hydroxybutyrate) depolymerase
MSYFSVREFRHDAQRISEDIFRRAKRGGLPSPAELAGHPSDLTLAALRLQASTLHLLARLNPVFAFTPVVVDWFGAADQVTNTYFRVHPQPEYDIPSVSIAGKDVAVTEEVLTNKIFWRLLRFTPDLEGGEKPKRKILILAPDSGHFGTFIRETIRGMLELGYTVHVMDSNNPRDIPLIHGVRPFNALINQVSEAIQILGEGVHVMAVCQPGPSALVSTALMAEDGDACTARSLIFMACPLDVEENPTGVNKLATEKPLFWFQSEFLAPVSAPYLGQGRDVYPGFLQFLNFKAMNLDTHVKEVVRVFHLLAAGKYEEAKILIDRAKEFGAVKDLEGTYFVDTISTVFQKNSVARGTLECVDASGQKRKPNLKAIGRPINGKPGTAIMTVEGEGDIICGIGQTRAARRLCPTVEIYEHVNTDGGHASVFTGKQWRNKVRPAAHAFINRVEQQHHCHG